MMAGLERDLLLSGCRISPAVRISDGFSSKGLSGHVE